MLTPLFAATAQYLFGILMFLTALFLILLVLVQRGRGGGLAGAFGGMGGQSAFGTKAGDLFTRLTMGAATFWIILCIFAIAVMNRQTSVLGGGELGSTPSAIGSAIEEETIPGASELDKANETLDDLLGEATDGLSGSGLSGGDEKESSPE